MTTEAIEALRPLVEAVLPSDWCFQPGEPPRRMQPDEVRFPDGSAGRMRMVGGLLLTGDGKNWSGTVDQLSTELGNFDTSQLARLQAFWDASQPKEGGWAENLRWSDKRPGAAEFDYCGVHFVYQGKPFTGIARPGPRTMMQVEAFFAAGPPVELAEEAEPKCQTCSGHRSLWLQCPECGRAHRASVMASLDSVAKPFIHDGGGERSASPEPARVTPSGEVKAPTVFDVTKKGEAGMVVNGFLWEAEESFRKVPDGTKGTLVFTEAALSDHIRRVDGPKGFHVAGSLNAQWAQEKLTPVDLTELREAWKNWAPGAGWLDGFNELLAAVERLVGK